MARFPFRRVALNAARARAPKARSGAEERAGSSPPRWTAFPRSVLLTVLCWVFGASISACTDAAIVSPPAQTPDAGGELVTIDGGTFRVTASTSAVIGPEGGTVGLENFLLSVPPGALTAPVRLTLQETDRPSPVGNVAASPVFRLLPAGTTFAAPIQASIVFEGDPATIQVMWSLPNGRSYEALTGSVDGNVITVSNTHFSDIVAVGFACGGDFSEVCGPNGRTCCDRCASPESNGCASCPRGWSLLPAEGNAPAQCARVTCAAGLVACGRECCRSCDPNNPGACGSCSADAYLSEGRCFTCAAGLSPCGDRCCNAGNCVNNQCRILMCRPGHSMCEGRCCGPGRSCTNGSCCPTQNPPLSACGDACLDLATNAQNCGRCGNRCPNNLRCVGGACGCSPRELRCNDRCVRNDNNNCGRCDNRCANNQRCVDGVCTLNCAAPLIACGDQCVDPRSNVDHCGGCDARCSRLSGREQTCTAGRCTCPAGLQQCDGQCVDLQVNNTHCGRCGTRCPTGEACTLGICKGPSATPEAPSSGSIVTSQQPTFRWRLLNGATGAVVDLCRDRACNNIVTSSPAVMGESWRPSMALEPGRYYWRTSVVPETVRERRSSVLPFDVPRRSAPIDSSALLGGGNFDGDAFDDVIASQIAVNTVGYFRGAMRGLERFTFSPTGPNGVSDFGFRVAFAGDLDNDGLADVIVGTPSTNTARVYLSRSIATAGYGGARLAPPTGARNFGWAVAGAGDLDRNGYADVIVGAPGSNHVRVYYYDLAGVALTRDLVPPNGARGFGNGVSSAGDVNGDGFADFLVTAPDSNQVFIYLGNRERREIREPAVTLSAAPAASTPRFGASASTAGDVDGDGYSDVLVGTFGVGFSLYRGGPMGTLLSPAFTWADRTLATNVVSAAGDVNGDGHGDVVVGQPEQSRTMVFYGGPSGLSEVAGRVATLTGPTGSGFGQSVRGAGDVNGDGFYDVLIGQPRSSPAAVSVFYGSASGVNPGSVHTVTGPRGFGFSVASLPERRPTRPSPHTSPGWTFGAQRLPLLASNLLAGVSR